MTNNENEMRSQFEERFEIPHGVFWSPEHGRYVTHQAHIACVQYQGHWEGWKASRQALVIVLPEPISDLRCHGEYRRGQGAMYDVTKAAIESQGVKCK